MEKESEVIAGSEVEALKQTVAEKDRETAKLSEELQTLQAKLQMVKHSSEAEEEEVYTLIVETSELRVKLVEVEDEKLEKERKLEVAHQHMELLQQLIVELREKKCSTSQVDYYVHC